MKDAVFYKQNFINFPEKTGGNRSAAARLLGISRVLVWNRMFFPQTFSEHRWDETKPLLTKLVGDHAEFVRIWFSWRPASPDPGDDHIIDCAMNARALVVTANVRDFEEAVRTLGLTVMTPVKFLEYLSDREN